MSEPVDTSGPAGPGGASNRQTELSEPDLLAAIAEVAREHLKWSGPIAPEMSLVEALALDSLRQLTLIVEIENRFRIRLDDGGESSLQTVGDLVALIARKRAEQRRDAR